MRPRDPVPADQAPTLRPTAPSPLPQYPPAGIGDRWTPKATVWVVSAVAGALGLPVLISAVIVPALRDRPAAQADLDTVAIRTRAERAAQDAALESLAARVSMCEKALDVADQAASQIKGLDARLTPLERTKRRPGSTGAAFRPNVSSAAGAELPPSTGPASKADSGR